MKKLYDYLMNPKHTVKLHNHQKDWQVWWVIVAVSSVISMAKWSSIDIFSFAVFFAINVSCLLLTSIAIDASAQCLGKKGQLKSILYWFGFNQAILWLMPSLEIIQNSILSLGSLLILPLNFIFIYYVWVILNQIYPNSKKQVILILALPFLFITIVSVLVFSWVTQKVLLF
ncbi:MAG: hypothetical protein VXX85_01555 [Candidatus Margulisiibacteriota bacterium]|nr:hypothetical protein [Candidatus Margulisiibacteriota bacterium]